MCYITIVCVITNWNIIVTHIICRMHNYVLISYAFYYKQQIKQGQYRIEWCYTSPYVSKKQYWLYTISETIDKNSINGILGVKPIHRQKRIRKIDSVVEDKNLDK